MRFDELCLHASDRRALELFARKAGVGLLLVAPDGYGKRTIANSLASMVADGRQFDIEVVQSGDNGSITIEQIRALKKYFVLKTNTAAHSRVAVIHCADEMTTEAQNALLKLLEEPPAGCFFILTTARPKQLLPTIHSRISTHTLTLPTASDLYMHLKKLGFDTDVVKVAGGLPGLSISIAKGESNDLVDAIAEVKALLGASTMIRLKSIDTIVKDKKKLERHLQALKIISSGTMLSLASSGKPSKKWESLTHSVLKAQSLIESNVSAKLVLTDLMLSI